MFLYFRKEIANPESTALQNIFCKIFGVRCEMGTPVWRHFPKFFKAVSMQHIATKQQWKVLNLEPFYISWGEKFDLPSFLEIRQSLWHHEVKIGPKGTKFIYYIPTVIKKTNSITVVFSRLVIHFWDRFFKTVILWPIPNPSLLRHFNIMSKEIRICIYY